ncbi:MAG: hypothetical protein DRP41_06555 [Thermodesulfobacteriota bacterium]|nr:MAG: hypothetical protein DRP41_06555 [Thermodesulfobacteriota bacterium]
MEKSTKVYKKGKRLKLKISENLWKYILENYNEFFLEKIKKSFPKFDEWVKGLDDPTIRQVEELSRKLFIPFGYFFLDKLPEEKLPVPFYRKGFKWEGKVSVELKEVLRDIQRKQDFLKDYFEYAGEKPLNFVGSININEYSKKCVNKIRQTLSLPEDWSLKLKNRNEAFNFLREKIEALRICVFTNSVLLFNNRKKLNPEEFKGISLVDKYAPVIFINTNDTLNSRIFTLMHELIHVFLGKGEILGDGEEIEEGADRIEIFCDNVSADLLAPQSLFLKKWKETEENIERLSDEFKVSPMVVIRRARYMSLINSFEYQSFKNDYLQKLKSMKSEKKTERGGGNFYELHYKRLSKNFILTVLSALSANYLSFTDAYNYLGVRGKTFDKFVELAVEGMRSAQVST